MHTHSIYILIAETFVGENFRELVKVERFANKTFADCILLLVLYHTKIRG